MHTVLNKKKLTLRVRRIRGQLKSIERSIQEEADGYEILQTIAAAKGALSGLLFEVIDGHVRMHVVDPKDRKQARAAEELLEIVRSYVR